MKATCALSIWSTMPYLAAAVLQARNHGEFTLKVFDDR
jgi:hypothetical protein